MRRGGAEATGVVLNIRVVLNARVVLYIEVGSEAQRHGAKPAQKSLFIN